MMALLLADNFRFVDGTDASLATVYGTPSSGNYYATVMNAGRWTDGGRVELIDDGWGSMNKAFGATNSDNTFIYKGDHYIGPPSNSARQSIFFLRCTGGTYSGGWDGEFFIGIQPDGRVQARRCPQASRNWDESTLIVESAYGVVKTGEWFTIEVKAVLATTAVGSVEIRINGKTVATATNVITAVQGTVFTTIHWECSLYWHTISNYAVANSVGSYNNDFFGDVRIRNLNPNADTSMQFTPNTGTVGWSLLDERLRDTNYVQATASGLYDQYGMEDLSDASETVLGVMLWCYAYAADATVALTAHLQNGTATSTGRTVAPPAYWYAYQFPFDTDPNTGGTFTGTSINSLDVGLSSL